jgi:RNA polymerase II elongation factor ELL
VGDTFFPTEPAPESSVHDIYIRATSARQKNPPLKYYARVVGKFVVQPDRVEKIGDKIGRSRKDAEELRQQRKIQMIDEPPANVLNAGKRKDVKPKKPALTPAPQRPTPTPSSNTSRSSTSTSSLGSDFRSRLIQCLATSPRTTEESIKLLLGRNPNPDTRKEFIKLLVEVCYTIPSMLGLLTVAPHRSRTHLHPRKAPTPRRFKYGL